MSNARGVTLLFLRISLGLLMIIWGADKLVNPAHGIVVAERFYFGLMSSASFMPALGIAEILLGLMVIAGILRQYSYVLLAIVTGITLVGVWRSVLDPWGWYLGKTNALFYPSLIVFAGVLVLMAFRDEDRLVVGRRR